MLWLTLQSFYESKGYLLGLWWCFLQTAPLFCCLWLNVISSACVVVSVGGLLRSAFFQLLCFQLYPHEPWLLIWTLALQPDYAKARQLRAALLKRSLHLSPTAKMPGKLFLHCKSSRAGLKCGCEVSLVCTVNWINHPGFGDKGLEWGGFCQSRKAMKRQR